MGIGLISRCEVLTMEKLDKIGFSAEDLCEALQGYASKLGETLDIRRILDISFEKIDEDFCDLQIESLSKGVRWETFSIDLIGAALMNYCALKGIELPDVEMRVVITRDSGVFLVFAE